jgi:LacI family transcriptional regulator
MAMTAIQAAQQAGFQVGETLSIIGFDDAPIARFAHPPLTTLRQPLPLITETLMTMLDAILQRNSYAPPQRLFLPELIIRESCAAPQSG